MPGGHQFTQKLFDTICKRIAEGNSLRAVCRADDMPDSSSVRRWLTEDELSAGQLCTQYARACEERAGQVFEDILEIADEARLDTIIDADGNEHTVHENIQRARLRVDARRWMLGKMQPKKYSDKLNLEASGSFTVNIGNDDADCG